MTIASSRNLYTFFESLLSTSSLDLTTMILECVLFYIGVVITFYRCYEFHLVALAAVVVAFVAADIVLGDVLAVLFVFFFILFALLFITLLFFPTFLDFLLKLLTLLLMYFFVCLYCSFWCCCSSCWCCWSSCWWWWWCFCWFCWPTCKRFLFVYVDGVPGDSVYFLVDAVGVSVDVFFLLMLPFELLLLTCCIAVLVAAVLANPR